MKWNGFVNIQNAWEPETEGEGVFTMSEEEIQNEHK